MPKTHSRLSFSLQTHLASHQLVFTSKKQHVRYHLFIFQAFNKGIKHSIHSARSRNNFLSVREKIHSIAKDLEVEQQGHEFKSKARIEKKVLDPSMVKSKGRPTTSTSSERQCKCYAYAMLKATPKSRAQRRRRK